MATGDIYTNSGAAAVIGYINTAIAATWAFMSGIGTTTPAKADTALGTTTGCPAKARPGDAATSVVTTTAANDTLQCVGTIAYSSALAITELGLFADATTGAMIQRHVFAAINVANGDSIQFTVKHQQA